MALDISALQSWAQNNSRQIASKAIGGAAFAKLLIANNSTQLGITGTAPILKMDSVVVLQDASGCSRTPLGSTVLGNAMISVHPIKTSENLCPKTLWNTYMSTMISKGGVGQDESFMPDFAEQLMTQKAMMIANAIEVALFQGDTASTSVNLSRFDGILKMGSSSSIVPAGADIIAKLQNIYSQTPVAIRQSEDFRLFVGQDVYDNYTIAIANKNIYKPVTDFSIFGTAAKVEVMPGLNGTNDVIASRISNFVLGMDGSIEDLKSDLFYSIETKSWYLDFEFSVGIAIANVSQLFIASVA